MKPIAVVCLNYAQFLGYLDWKKVPKERAHMITGVSHAETYVQAYGNPDEIVVLPLAVRPGSLLAILRKKPKKQKKGARK